MHISNISPERPADDAAVVSINVVSLANLRNQRHSRENSRASRPLDVSPVNRLGHACDCPCACTRTKTGSAARFVLPTAKASRADCIDLGATTESLASVVATAVEFSAWRLGSFSGRDDGVWAASEWSMWQRDRLLGGAFGEAGPALLTSGVAGTSARAARATVRWALARFAYLLRIGLALDVAVRESVTIPLEASMAHPVTWEEHRARRERGEWFSRDNVVPGTVPVWAVDAEEFRTQRIFARRLLTIDSADSVHNGWATVATEVASHFGWEVVEPAPS